MIFGLWFSLKVHGLQIGAPQKEVEPIAPNSEAESQQNILYRNTNTGRKKKKEEATPPPPYESGECSSSGSRRPGHPHSTPWSCEMAKTKFSTHLLQGITTLLCPRQYLRAHLLYRGALCRISHQPGKHPSYT